MYYIKRIDSINY